MNWKRPIPILLAAALAVTGAAAEELTVSVGSAIEYDSNPERGTSDDGDSSSGAFGSRVHTQITLDGANEGRFDYSLRYRPTYAYFPSATESNGFTHDFTANFDMQLGPRTTLTGSERLRIAEVFAFDQEDPVLDSTGNVVETREPIESGRELALRNSATMGLSHQLSDRLTWSATGSQTLFHSNASNRVNSQTFSGQTALNYRIDGATTFGGGASVTLQQFDSAETSNVSQSTTNTYIYRAFANLVRRFGETTTLTLQIGPALIQTDQAEPDQSSAAQEIPFVRIPEDAVPGSDETRFLVGLQIDDSGGALEVLPTEVVLPPGSLILGDFRECPSLQGSDILFGQGCSAFSNASGLLFLANDDNFGPQLLQQHQEKVDALNALTDEQLAMLKPSALAFREAFLAYEYPVGYSTAGHTDAINAILERPIDLSFEPGTEPPTPSDTQLTLFGSAQLSKRWSENVVTTLAYTRSQSNASGLATSTIEDQVTLNGTWKPSQRWHFRAGGWWVQRQSISSVVRTFHAAGPIATGDVPASLFLVDGAQLAGRNGILIPIEIDNPVDTTRWGFQLQAERKITQHLIGNMRFTYNNQNSRNGFGDETKLTDWLVSLGLNYTFDPVSFW